jgi:sulfur carrier protein
VKIIVNGEEISLPQNSNIDDLINQLGFQNKRIAVEINESIIPKSKHSSFFLKAKDRIEVIDAVGGG